MPDTKKPSRLSATTLRSVDPQAQRRASGGVAALTVVHHSDVSRVGEVCRLTAVLAGGTVALSRSEPEFSPATGGPGRPLEDPWVSRRAVMISAGRGGGVVLTPAAGGPTARVDDVDLSKAVEIPADLLSHGVLIQLGSGVILLLHRVAPPRRTATLGGFVGHSQGIEDVRATIGRLAELDVPVLVRGESGTGKELVARAIHDSSSRSGRPFVAVNMGAVPSSVAASELFGHVKGAFSGAARDHSGFFGAADGGTLFLDEIADTPPEVQAMLLRALETGEVQPVGARTTRSVDVRLLAATDANLEAAVEVGTFRRPLLYRLAGYQLHVPPLRERRDDVARLFVHFLREELGAAGCAERLDWREGETPWLPASLATLLLRHPWPGNVRELRNVARQLVVANRDASVASLDVVLEQQLREGGATAAVTGQPRTPTLAASELDEDDVIEALRAHGWRTAATATALGISRTTLYRMIDASSRIVKAADLDRATIEAALARVAGDVTAAAGALEVSKRGLQLRMKDVGLRD